MKGACFIVWVVTVVGVYAQPFPGYEHRSIDHNLINECCTRYPRGFSTVEVVVRPQRQRPAYCAHVSCSPLGGVPYHNYGVVRSDPYPYSTYASDEQMYSSIPALAGNERVYSNTPVLTGVGTTYPDNRREGVYSNTPTFDRQVYPSAYNLATGNYV